MKGDVKEPSKDPAFYDSFMRELVEKINMVILMGPYSTYCNLEGNEGVTSVVIIQTSHIVIHVWDSGQFQIDVYTCSDLNPQDVFDHLSDNFNVGYCEYFFIDRNGSLSLTDFGVF